MPEVETVTIPVRIEWIGGGPYTWTTTITESGANAADFEMVEYPRKKKGRKFRVILAVENQRLTDGRMIMGGALYTREPPLPLMWSNRNNGHEDSIFVGNILQVWRNGPEVWAAGEFDYSPEALEAQRLVEEGKLRGVSMDTYATDMDTFEQDGRIFTDIRRMEMLGATILPFAAFDNTKIELWDDEEEMLVAALDGVFTFDDPGAFKMPEPDVATPWTVTEDGRVFGHLALWGECHQGISDRCVLAPRSRSGYANYMIGRIGDQNLGTVTMNTVHIGGGYTRQQVIRHYADTGTVAAYVSVVDGKFGPWVSGVVEPTLSEVDRRRLATVGISGDWRGNELVAILACPTPGYTVPRYDDDYALVASLGTFDCVGCEESKIAAAEVAEMLEDTELEVVVEVIEETTVTIEDETEPTDEEIEEVDEDLVIDIDTILDDVLREIADAEAAAALERILLDE